MKQIIKSQYGSICLDKSKAVSIEADTGSPTITATNLDNTVSTLRFDGNEITSENIKRLVMFGNSVEILGDGTVKAISAETGAEIQDPAREPKFN